MAHAHTLRLPTSTMSTAKLIDHVLAHAAIGVH
jgi:hypothetical protein